MNRPGPLALCAFLLALAGCDLPLVDCGDVRSVAADATLAVSAVPGATRPPGDSLGRLPAALGVGFALFEDNRREDPELFGDLMGAVADGAAFRHGEGLSLMLGGTVRGRDATTARLVLVLPTPLRAGARFPVGSAFPPPVGLHNPEVYGYEHFGRRPLRRPGEAEVALFWGYTRFVPPDPFAVEYPEFVAKTAAGSVEVVSDRGRELLLRLDLVAADSAGRPVRVGGDVRARGVVEERECRTFS